MQTDGIQATIANVKRLRQDIARLGKAFAAHRSKIKAGELNGLLHRVEHACQEFDRTMGDLLANHRPRIEAWYCSSIPAA